MEITPENRRAYDHVRGLALVGGVIARASEKDAQRRVMQDSARHVLRAAEQALTHEADPRQELLPLIGYMYSVLGDTGRTIELLRRYAAVNPHASFEHHWRWRDLRGRADFQPLLVEHH